MDVIPAQAGMMGLRMTPEQSGAPKGRGLKSDQFSGLMLLALALYVGWQNRVYPIGTLSEPGPGYLPLLLAIFLGSMGLLIALWGARSAPLAAVKWTEATRAVIILATCAAATFALERIGYRGAVVVEVMAPGPDPFRAIKDDRSALILDDYLRESLACLRRTLP